MTKHECKCCKTVFWGRSNQVFCSAECKNDYHNKKTRLMYQAGKDGLGKIDDLIEQEASRSASLKQAIAVNSESRKLLAEENLKLQEDYYKLLDGLKDAESELKRLRRNHQQAINSKLRQQQQEQAFEALGQMLKPMIEKAAENISSFAKK